ncbi:hypothetical protein BDQ17DRAFT_1355117, partial [Cyathus striatus]
MKTGGGEEYGGSSDVGDDYHWISYISFISVSVCPAIWYPLTHEVTSGTLQPAGRTQPVMALNGQRSCKCPLRVVFMATIACSCMSRVAQATDIPPPTKAVLPLSIDQPRSAQAASWRQTPSFAPKPVVLDLKERVGLEYSGYPVNWHLGVNPRREIMKLEDGDV